MATATSSLAPILEPTAEMVAAVAELVRARQAEDLAADHHGVISPEYRAACAACNAAELAVERAFPAGQLGWYPIAGRLWGRTKVDGTGLRLVNKAAAWGMEHPAREKYQRTIKQGARR